MWKDAEGFLSQDKYLGALVVKWGNCTVKPIKKSMYFEDLVDAICSQQLSGKAAQTIFGRVKTALVGKITPESIQKIDTEALRNCGLSYAKCSYVKDLAEKVIKKELQISKLDNLPDEEVIKELVAVKGIGRWTAEMFLMFSLGRADIFPVDDLGIKKAVCQLFNKSMTSSKDDISGSSESVIKTIKSEELLKISERWRPYRTVACWYLYRSLENR